MHRTFTLRVAALALFVVGLFAFVPARPAVAAETEKKSAATFEVYKDKGGEYRWRLRMQNSKVIASSGEGYTTKRACEDAIESVKKNAVDAPVEEKSEEPAPAAKE